MLTHLYAPSKIRKLPRLAPKARTGREGRLKMRKARNFGDSRYIDPSVTTHFDMEHRFARTDALLTFAETNVRYGKLISSNSYLQRLDWPESDPAAHDGTADITQYVRSYEEQEFDEKYAARVYLASKQPDDTRALTRKFKLLRQHFTSIRDRSCLPKFGNGGRSKYDALVEGMLNHVFIVICYRWYLRSITLHRTSTCGQCLGLGCRPRL
jgi:hypothetical protein